MKKLILFLVLIALSVTAYASFTNSADTPRATFRNGYAWSGHSPRDKAQLWAQEVEAKLEGETAILSKLTVASYTAAQTLTAAQSGSVIVMASTGTGVLTLPTAAAGLHYYVIDGSATAAADAKITAASGDGINDGSAAGSITQTLDTAGLHVHIVAIDTASWITISISGVWTAS